MLKSSTCKETDARAPPLVTSGPARPKYGVAKNKLTSMIRQDAARALTLTTVPTSYRGDFRAYLPDVYTRSRNSHSAYKRHQMTQHSDFSRKPIDIISYPEQFHEREDEGR